MKGFIQERERLMIHKVLHSLELQIHKCSMYQDEKTMQEIASIKRVMSIIVRHRKPITLG